MNDLNFWRNLIRLNLAHSGSSNSKSQDSWLHVHFIQLQIQLHTLGVLPLINNLVHNPEDPFDLFAL